MIDRPDVSLGSRRTTSGAVLVDHACGTCAACTAGSGLWCLAPTVEGRDLSPELPVGRVDEIATALLAGAAVEVAPVGTVLVLGPAEGATARLVRSVATGRVVAATDPRSARPALAGEPTGRAAIVIAGADARAAVRAVRRGGHVCLVDPAAVAPSVTELVQREVTLVAPLDVARIADRVAPDLWAALVAA